MDAKGLMGVNQFSGANTQQDQQNKFATNSMPMDYFVNPLNIPIAGSRPFGVVTPDLNTNAVQAHQILDDKFVTNHRRDRMPNRDCASEAGSPCRSMSGSPTGRRCTSTSPIRRAIRTQKVASAPQPPSVDMMTCCVQLMASPGQPSARVTQALEAFAASVKAGQREEAMRAAKRSKGLLDGHTDELADTLAKIGVDDEEEDKKIGQSPIERHKLLAWRPPTNGKINIDVFKSKDGTSHSVNVKGAKSWSEFQEAVTQLVSAVRELVPDVEIKQNQARVALTKSSFHIGHCIDIGNLNIADDFAEVCTRKKKGAEAAVGKAAKTNGGLVLKLHKWNAKVMLHGNGRGDMWWPTSDLENMTEAYNALCAHLNISGHPSSPSSSVSSPLQHPLESDLMPPPQPLVRKGGSFKKKMSEEGQPLFSQGASNPVMQNQAFPGFKAT
uniref:Uncharacterized protein n=1 Tax=Guillardia theta TaxID=55529 RepID=A0A7S4K9W9_GUITH